MRGQLGALRKIHAEMPAAAFLPAQRSACNKARRDQRIFVAITRFQLIDELNERLQPVRTAFDTAIPAHGLAKALQGVGR